MMSMVQTRVGTSHATSSGTARPSVLLHATLHDRRDFDPIVAALFRDHRVIAIDWPGHGDSPAPEPIIISPLLPPSPMCLPMLLPHFSLNACRLIGNSVGGFAAAQLAITDPQRVSRLVLVNSGGFIASPFTNLYCRTLGMPAVMKRVLPRSIRSYMKATSDNDHAVQERALARASTPRRRCSHRRPCGVASLLPNMTCAHTPIASPRRAW